MSIGKINNRVRSRTRANFNRIDFQAAQGQTTFDLADFLLTAGSVVYVNGSPVSAEIYTGTGTKTLQFNVGLNEYDEILIIG